MKRSYIINLILGFFAYNLLGFLTNGNHIILLPLTCSAYFMIAFFRFEKTTRKLEPTAIFVLMELIFIALLIFVDQVLEPITYLYLVFMPLFSYFGYFAKRNLKWMVPAIASLILLSTLIFDNWISYYYSRNDEVIIDFPEIKLFHAKQEETNISEGIVVLDFWTLRCGKCFQQFPHYNDMSKEFSDENVKFYNVLATNQRVNIDSLRKKHNIGTPTLLLKQPNLLTDSLNINGVPHLLILKDGKIRFSGSFIYKKNIIFGRSDFRIEKLLEE